MKLPVLLLLLALTGIVTSADALEYPLTIAADGRSLIDARGDRVVLHGAAPWNLSARLTREEVTAYLDARSGQGIDALLMALMVSDGFGRDSFENAYGEVPFLAPGDFSRPNEAYFSHVDWILSEARQRGITVLLSPLYLGWQCGDEGWCSQAQAAGPDRMRDFGRWVGQRFLEHPNIIWVQGGDADAREWRAMDIVDAVAEGIAEVDPVHLQTAHCDRGNSARDCYDRPWLDLDATYSDCGRTPAQIRADYERFPAMPVLYLEGDYEFEHDATAQCIRAQAWWAALGGVAGQFYGSGRTWDFPDEWREGLDTEGTGSMEQLTGILSARARGGLIPDYADEVLVAGRGNLQGPTWAAAALGADGNSAVVYLPTPRTVSLALDRIEGTEVDAWWVDPALGDGRYEGRFPTTGTRDFTSPGTGDWVLVVDNVAANLPTAWNSSTVAGNAPGRLDVELLSASPNPFNPRTVIAFAGPADTQLEVTVYDPRGRRVRQLFEGPATGSTQTLVWAADDLASGSYFVRVTGGGQSSVRKVVLLK